MSKTNGNKLFFAAGLFTGLLFVAGCATGGDGESSSTCRPGDMRPCTCPDSSTGGQSCLGDGSGWTVCLCAGDGDDYYWDDDDDYYWDDDDDGDDCYVNPVEGAWGNACDPKNLHKDCSNGTTCLTFDGVTGWCAAECCNFISTDPTYCTNQTSGTEECFIYTDSKTDGPFYCNIACNDASDCPKGTDCLEIPGWKKICQGFADTDTDTDSDSDTDTDTDTDTDFADCPLNSGYPCACDKEECADGSQCWTFAKGGGVLVGFCGGACADASACKNTQGWGVVGDCILDTTGDGVGDYCGLICEEGGDDCPPGLECKAVTGQSWWACY